MIDEIVGQAKSNQGNRNDLTSGSLEPEVNKETNVKLAELANTRLSHHGLAFFSSPHLYIKIIKSFKGTTRVAVSKCTEILKNFFSLYKCLTINVYPILKL